MEKYYNQPSIIRNSTSGSNGGRNRGCLSYATASAELQAKLLHQEWRGWC
jgi:hypothetical protein